MWTIDALVRQKSGCGKDKGKRNTQIFNMCIQKSLPRAILSKTCFYIHVNFINSDLLNQLLTLRKVSVFGVILVRIFSVFFHIRISPYSVRMWENADQNNSEYGHFLCKVNTVKLAEQLIKI